MKTPKAILVLVVMAGVPVIPEPAGATQTAFLNRSIVSGDTALPNRPSQNGIASSCSNGKTFTASIAAANRHFDKYSLTVSGTSSPACVLVQLNGSACGTNKAAHSMAAQPAFVPASIGTGYLGDAASSSNAGVPTLDYSFLANPGAFEIIVHDIGTTTDCDNYSLTVYQTPHGATSPASSVSNSAATLGGVVDGEGAPAGITAHFEYGNTTSYGASTPAIAMTTANGQTATAPISGLEPNSTYHFRIVASHPASSPFPAGSFAANDQAFTTSSTPIALSGDASALASRTASIAGTANPQNAATDAQFEYGTTASYGQTTTLQAVGSDATDHTVQAVLQGLTPSTTYHYRVAAKQGATTVNGSDRTFTTPADPPPVGDPPSGGGGPTAIASASALTLSPSAFPAASKGASVAAKPKRKTGTTVRYRLTAAARVRFTVDKPAAGRKVGKRCVKPTRANRKRPRCKRFVAVRGSFTHTGKTGQNSFRFTGRLSGRKLARGSYRLIATPLGADGRRGTPIRKTFRITR